MADMDVDVDVPEKKTKGGASGKDDSKQRFEVKKVCATVSCRAVRG
jgi:hypothetical protein